MTGYVSPFTGDVIQPTDVSYRAFTLTADVTLSWPINGNATDNYAARIMEVTPNAAGRKLYMPPANQTSVGTDALIRNLSAYSFTVVDNSGNTIITIAAGKAWYIYITTNSTVAGTWGVIDFGAGTSSADAATLAGLGLIAISTTLNQSHPASSFANGYTFTTSDRSQTKVWSSGSGTVNLPAVATAGNNWFFLLKNNGTGSLTVDCNLSETIDGGLTKTYAPGESSFIICTGTEYVTVGYGVSSTFAFTALVYPVTSGAYSLTSSEASNTIQEFVGILTGNVTVTYPPVVNLYVVSNQTTDNGYSLTLTTGVVGGSNAIIPPGQQATLICDGTNFLNANTTQAGATSISLVNGSVGTPSLNFGAETSTGIYRPGAGEFAISVLGTQRVDVTATGMTVTGSGTFTTGIAGGVFT
jgi:hypothetical protein